LKGFKRETIEKIPKPLSHRTYSSKKQPEIGKTREVHIAIFSPYTGHRLHGMRISAPLTSLGIESHTLYPLFSGLRTPFQQAPQQKPLTNGYFLPISDSIILLIMSLSLQPIYLLADSQLLFWRNKDTLFLDSIKKLIARAMPKAAYVGASNSDDPVFYSIFEAAMEGVGIQDCKMILSSFPEEDELFINDSDIILLAGGDVEKGWDVFSKVGLRELIIKKYYEGTLLIGVSAGAVQLGLFGLVEVEESFNKLIDTFKLVPFIISVHDEGQEWKSLRETIQLLNSTTRGIGIPTGGGLIYYPDQSIEAIRYPLSEYMMKDGVMNHSLVIARQEQ
jgi:peptidase E